MKLKDFVCTCKSDSIFTDIYYVKSEEDVCDIEKWNFIYSGPIEDAKGIEEKILEKEIISWNGNTESVDIFDVFIIM